MAEHQDTTVDCREMQTPANGAHPSADPSIRAGRQVRPGDVLPGLGLPVKYRAVYQAVRDANGSVAYRCIGSLPVYSVPHTTDPNAASSVEIRAVKEEACYSKDPTKQDFGLIPSVCENNHSFSLMLSRVWNRLQHSIHGNSQAGPAEPVVNEKYLVEDDDPDVAEFAVNWSDVARRAHLREQDAKRIQRGLSIQSGTDERGEGNDVRGKPTRKAKQVQKKAKRKNYNEKRIYAELIDQTANLRNQTANSTNAHYASSVSSEDSIGDVVEGVTAREYGELLIGLTHPIEATFLRRFRLFKTSVSLSFRRLEETDEASEDRRFPTQEVARIHSFYGMSNIKIKHTGTIVGKILAILIILFMFRAVDIAGDYVAASRRVAAGVGEFYDKILEYESKLHEQQIILARKLGFKSESSWFVRVMEWPNHLFVPYVTKEKKVIETLDGLLLVVSIAVFLMNFALFYAAYRVLFTSFSMEKDMKVSFGVIAYLCQPRFANSREGKVLLQRLQAASQVNNSTNLGVFQEVFNGTQENSVTVATWLHMVRMQQQRGLMRFVSLSFFADELDFRKRRGELLVYGCRSDEVGDVPDNDIKRVEISANTTFTHRGVEGKMVQGYTFQGFATIRCDHTDFLTISAGAAKRFVRKPPDIKGEILEKLRVFVSKWLVNNLVPIDQSEYPTDFKQWQLQWLENSGIPARRKKKYYKIVEEGQPLRKIDYLVKGFPKAEGYPTFKFTRLINSRSDEFKCFTGPFFSAMEKIVYSKSYFIKHVPVSERANYIMEKLSTYAKFIASDYTSFEVVFVPKLMNAVEFQLYDYMTCKLSMHDEFMHHIRRALLGKNDIRYHNVRIKVPATRMSGEMCTSLGNGFSNLMFFLFACDQQGIETDGVVEGDDALFGVSEYPDESIFEEMGLIIKLEKHTILSDAGFCGLVFDSFEKVIICNPLKHLANFGFVHRTYVGCSRKTELALMRSKALSLLYQFPGMPILQELCCVVLSDTENVKFYSLLKALNNMDAYEQTVQRQAIQLHNTWKSQVRQVSPTSRMLVERHFNVPVEVQYLVESKIRDHEFDIDVVKDIVPIDQRRFWQDYIESEPTEVSSTCSIDFDCEMRRKFGISSWWKREQDEGHTGSTSLDPKRLAVLNKTPRDCTESNFDKVVQATHNKVMYSTNGNPSLVLDVKIVWLMYSPCATCIPYMAKGKFVGEKPVKADRFIDAYERAMIENLEKLTEDGRQFFEANANPLGQRPDGSRDPWRSSSGIPDPVNVDVTAKTLFGRWDITLGTMGIGVNATSPMLFKMYFPHTIAGDTTLCVEIYYCNGVTNSAGNPTNVTTLTSAAMPTALADMIAQGYRVAGAGFRMVGREPLDYSTTRLTGGNFNHDVIGSPISWGAIANYMEPHQYVLNDLAGEHTGITVRYVRDQPTIPWYTHAGTFPNVTAMRQHRTPVILVSPLGSQKDNINVTVEYVVHFEVAVNKLASTHRVLDIRPEPNWAWLLGAVTDTTIIPVTVSGNSFKDIITHLLELLPTVAKAGLAYLGAGGGLTGAAAAAGSVAPTLLSSLLDNKQIRPYVKAAGRMITSAVNSRLDRKRMKQRMRMLANQ